MPHVVVHTPELHVPPLHECSHEPQSVLDVWRSWQPSLQLVYGFSQTVVP